MKNKIFLMLCICFFIVSITTVNAGENDTLQNLDLEQGDNGSETDLLMHHSII